MINKKKVNDFGLLKIEERIGKDRKGKTVKARFIVDNRGKIWGIGYSYKYTKLLIMLLLVKYGTELNNLEAITNV